MRHNKWTSLKLCASCYTGFIPSNRGLMTNRPSLCHKCRKNVGDCKC